MIKLYAYPRSRSILVEWYFQEIGLEYETVQVNMAEKEHKAESFLKINPWGKVPALEDDGIVLTESGAMMLYGAEKHGVFKTLEDRAQAYQWVLFGNSTLAENFINEPAKKDRLPGILEGLDNKLGSMSDLFLAGSFSICDVAVGCYLFFIPKICPEVDMSGYKHIAAYVERLQARPAWQVQAKRLKELEEKLA